MPIPTWDVAHQRNDNFAAGFLAAGARTVFAYSWQLYTKALRDLMTTDKSMREIFETPGSSPTAYFGWIGQDARMFDSVRTPGTVNYLDRDPRDGFLRGVSGDLTMTAGQWRGEESTANLRRINVPPIGPTAPSRLTGTAYDNRNVQLVWNPATMTHYGDVRYVVVRNNKSVGTWTTNSYYREQLSSPGTYTYAVRAIDAAGVKGPLSNLATVNVVVDAGATLPPPPTSTPSPSPTATPTTTPTPTATPTPTPTPSATPRPTPTATPTPTPTPTATPSPSANPDKPSAPQNFGAVLGTAGDVTLSWSASAAAAGPVTYRVFRGGVRVGAKITELTYTDQPAPGASYSYKVKAIDARGLSSPFSATITVEVPGSVEVGTPPSVPSGLTAVSLAERQVYLSWIPSTDDQPGGITYKVFRGGTLIATVTQPFFVDIPSSAGTYVYSLKAVDAAGNRSGMSAGVRGYAVD
jgi:fibronectin type 3 domain-containing protein